MVRVLLLGAGTMGSVHAEAYHSLPGVELAGIVDIREEAADKLAEATGAASFHSLETAMDELNDIDAIDVCLPTYLHKEYAMKAAEKVENVICEKPLARSTEEAREMIDHCKKRGVKLFVGHVVRFFQEYNRIKEIVKAGKIGKPAVVRTTRGGAFPKAWQNWYGDFEKSGGLILDLLLHDFDYLRATFGEVERVFAKKIKRKDADQLIIDYALVTLRFKSGLLAHLEGTWAHQGFSSGIEVAGTEGIINYDSAKITPLKHTPRVKEAGAGGVEVPESPLVSNPYRDELKHFISCIKNGSDPIVSAEDGLHAIEIATAAQLSCESGKPVMLNTTADIS
ncbi:Gfo/Idh/MocA family protein [Thalassobacillus pellis]|uniref:Gfo/Idh/MocA family protein n=1 Tax=Thalassobacillus pellis TaxID=748008 RepID=UPI00195F8500|nr:Gfo/Idh/MocA family oxidoreductase [Thalassobacillus pellis]MBM7551588.1 putative dehydrogenase [Thalassobacillus pellis]